MRNVLFFFPFAYFVGTRLNTIKNMVFHAYFEWGAAFLVLIFFQEMPLFESVKAFAIGYLAFISVYEIGYITNDVISARYEDSPRNRLGDEVSTVMPLLWILVRLGVFLCITFWQGYEQSPLWWGFYAALAISFLLHNTLRNVDFRLISFLNLSVFRFFGPFFIFIAPTVAQMIFPVVLLHYSFYRSLIYMDSKDLLKVPSRKSPLFNFSYFLITLLITLFFAGLSVSWKPLYLSLYFLIFTLCYYLFGSRFKT